MNEQFEQWVRESAPAVQVNEMKMEAHLAVLKERLRNRDVRRHRQHRKYRRTGMVAVVLLLFLGGGYFSKLGSDGYEHIWSTEEAAIEGATVENEFMDFGQRKHSITKMEGKSEDYHVELMQLVEAGLGTPVFFGMLQIHGKQWWSIYNEYETSEGIEGVGSSTNTRPGEQTEAHTDFLNHAIGPFMARIKSGETPVSETRLMEVDGHVFLTKIYVDQVPGFGEVIYYKGKPIPANGE